MSVSANVGKCHAVLSAYPFNSLNSELNPICHLLALLEAHHILHVSRVMFELRVKSHLLTLLENHHILHVSRVRVKLRVKSHLLILLEAHNILHVNTVRVKLRVNSHLPSSDIIRSSPYSPR